MKYYKKIIGERVYLSPMCVEDVGIYTRWLNNPFVADTIGGGHFNNSALACGDWYEKKTKDANMPLFAIVKHNGDVPIGSIEFFEIEARHRTASICIFIGDEENCGKGYGTEAMRLALKHGFGVLNLNNINLYVYSFNERAIKSYIKSGFKEYGRRRQAYYLNGVYHDVVCMDILKDEFEL